MNTGSLYAELTGKINRVRRKEHGIALQGGIINALAATLAIWTIAISIEALAELEPAGRTPVFFAAVILTILAAGWLVLPPLARWLGLLKGQDDDTLARRIGHGIPDIGDHLVNTLQLYRTSTAGALAGGYSLELVEASITTQGEPLRHYDYTVIIERDERRRALLFFLSGVFLLSGLFLSFPRSYNGAFQRLINYNVEYNKPAPFSLSIEPGNRKLIRGDSVDIVVRVAGVPPRSVKLLMTQGDRPAEEIELRADSTGLFRYHLASIKETTKYRAVSGPARTPEHTFIVVERPEIKLLRATVSHPGYTGRGAERLPDNIGDVSGLRGTAVNIQITTTIDVSKATIVQLFPRGGSARLASISTTSAPAAPTVYDTVRIPMTVNGSSASGGFRLSRDGEYYISLLSADGISNSSPVRYRMSASSDGPPSIELVQPGDSVTIDPTMLLPTEVRIADDYGFSRLRIMYRLAASNYAPPMKTFAPVPIQIPRSGGLSLSVPYIWDMTQMSMVPEDEVEFYFEVYDNDAVSGPKVARTGIIKVRFPSLEETLREAEQMQNQANADLQKVMKDAEGARKEMEELNRELMKQLAQNQSQASWQDKQKLEQLMKQHEAMQQRLEQISENLKEMTEKLKEAKAISPETLEKYMELQKLFNEMKNPELMEQMKKLQEQMEKMTPEQLAEAMKNYKFNEEQFRKSIERTMNILKRMQTEQKVDEMIRRAEELARQQEKLNKQMESVDPKDQAMRQQLAERQEQLAKQAEKMKQEMKDLSKEMSEQGEDMPKKEMQDAEQSLEQDNPQEQMEQAEQEMEQGEMQNARQQGEKAQQSAEQFKQKMQAVKKKMQENGKREVLNKMKKSLKDLLDLSKRQEELKKKTDETQPNSQQFRELAQEQKQLEEQMENIANQMMQLGQKSFAVTPEMAKEMGDAMQQMQGATQELEQRNGFGASQQEGGAMQSMNNAAKMMSQAIGQMQNQGEGQGMGMGMGQGSMQQRLQQMAAQQQMINQAMGQQQGQGQQGQQGEGEGEGKEGKEGKGGKDGQGGEGAGGEKEGKGGKEMQRLRQQQENVKKSIDDLNKEVRESGGTKKNMLGDLERAAKEIDEVLTDMRSGQLSPETMRRQERILSRLLDAARSQRERDFEKERESKPGTDVVRQGPGDLKFKDEVENMIRREQLRSREQGYSKDYEYMIRKYFEALGKSPSSGN